MAQRSRPYNSPVRARQAEATRQAILGAARRLFAQTGYQPTTVENIAARAGVSVPTVYAAFRSKQGILAALVAGAVGDPAIRRIAREAESAADPERRIRLAARVMRLALESEADLIDVLWQAGSGNAEVLQAWRQMHANRHRRLTEVFSPVLAEGGERFLDLAWAFGSPELFRLLVEERGWSPERFEDWLGDQLVELYRAKS